MVGSFGVLKVFDLLASPGHVHQCFIKHYVNCLHAG